jgi:hypothetical protein
MHELRIAFLLSAAVGAALFCNSPVTAQYQNPGDLPDAPLNLSQAQLDARAPIVESINEAHEAFDEAVLAHGELVSILEQLQDLLANTDPDCPVVPAIEDAIDALQTESASYQNSVLLTSTHLSWVFAYNITAQGDASAQGWQNLYASALGEANTIKGVSQTLRGNLNASVSVAQSLLDALTALVNAWDEDQGGGF